jgi:hypothetical protein
MIILSPCLFEDEPKLSSHPSPKTTMASATTIAGAPNFHAEMDQEKRERREDRESRSQVMIVSKGEAMNPTWRATMEDLCVIHAAGEWGAPDKDMAYFGVYDGHGGELTQQSHVLLRFVYFPHCPSSL